MYDHHCVRHMGHCKDVRCDECPYRSAPPWGKPSFPPGGIVVTDRPGQVVFVPEDKLSPVDQSWVDAATTHTIVTNTPRAGEAPGARDRSEYDPYAAPNPFLKAVLKDNVNLPDHYARFKIEPVHFIGENKLDWFQGNVVKYVLRHDAKNGVEDLRKAIRYLEMYIKYIEGDADWWKRGA